MSMFMLMLMSVSADGYAQKSPFFFANGKALESESVLRVPGRPAEGIAWARLTLTEGGSWCWCYVVTTCSWALTIEAESDGPFAMTHLHVDGPGQSWCTKTK